MASISTVVAALQAALVEAQAVAGASPAPIPAPVPVPVPVAGLIPALGSQLLTTQFNRGPADWIDPSKLPAPIPWTNYYDATNRILAPSQNGVRAPYLKKIHVWGNTNGLHGRIPMLRNGKHEQWSPQAGEDFATTIIQRIKASPAPVGPRGVGLVDPYITWHGHPTVAGNLRAPLYVGIRADGMLTYLFSDGSIKEAGLIAGVKGPHDYALNPVNRKIFFVADTLNGRIVAVDRTAAIAAKASSGFEDAKLWTVSTYCGGFVKPTSVRVLDDGRMFGCDQTAGKLYQVTAGSKTAVFNIPGVFFVDYLSDGRLAVVTDNTDVFLLDPVAETQSANLMPASERGKQSFFTISVDRAGTFGPKDEFVVSRDVGPANTDMWQFRKGGTVMVKAGGGGENHEGYFDSDGRTTVGSAKHCGDAWGHYLWVGEYHPDQGVFLTQGFANALPALFRAPLPSDAPEDTYNHLLFLHGLAIMRVGTTAAYQAAHGIYSRPSFTSLMDEFGWSLLGCTADYIAEMTYANAAKFVQGGMIGVFPRPEITGYDLYAILYFLYRSSQRFIREGATLMEGLKAFIGSVTATTPPTVPDVSYDGGIVRIRTVRIGNNLVARGETVDENESNHVGVLPATLKLEIIVDEGRPNEWRSGTLSSPWTVPTPPLSVGPHVTTTYPRNNAAMFSCQNVI